MPVVILPVFSPQQGYFGSDDQICKLTLMTISLSDVAKLVNVWREAPLPYYANFCHYAQQP